MFVPKAREAIERDALSLRGIVPVPAEILDGFDDSVLGFFVKQNFDGLVRGAFGLAGFGMSRARKELLALAKCFLAKAI